MTNKEFQAAEIELRKEARKRKRDIMNVCASCRHSIGHSVNCPYLE
jgi:hypothetical protein